MKKLLSADAEIGRETYFHSQFDGNKRLWIIESKQNVTPFIERAKREYNAKDRHSRWGDMQKVATIPFVVMQQLKQSGISDDPKRMKAWLNDRQNQMFRTRPGRV